MPSAQSAAPIVNSFAPPSLAHDALTYLEELLADLDAPATRKYACQRLHKLADDLEKNLAGDTCLTHKRVQTPGFADLRLILHPAVFPPEQWSRTFAEGLLKNVDAYAGKKMVELGVGCGWISILLLETTACAEILGLDINPIAITVSRVNAWLNGTTSDGQYRLSRAGRPIPEAFKAEVSDLLAVALERNQSFDHIVGCIPQVLHPDPEALKRIEDTPTEKDLYDLSNYCFEQGIIEDRYGLPLVARALAQSHLCLKPGGQVTFMMGGRPGIEPIEAMFRRRGFSPALVWSRRVCQAEDTDIASLAALERVYGIDFRFYVSPVSSQSVPAQTVTQLLAAGRPVYHDVFVYRAEPKLESTSVVLQNLHRLGIAAAGPEMDLSRIEDRLSRFLEYLTTQLLKQRLLPPAEDGALRKHSRITQVANLASRFLRTYCQFSVPAEELVIGKHARLVPSLLHALASGSSTVVVSDCVLQAYKDLVAVNGLVPIVGNNDLSDLLDMDEALSPRACIIAPSQLRDSSAPLVVRLLAQHADRHRDRLYIIDDSQHFNADCEQNGHLILKLLAHRALAPNIVLLYRHSNLPFEMTGLLNVPSQIRSLLDLSPPTEASQVFYEWLFGDLLRFTMETDYLDRSCRDANPVPEELAFAILRELLSGATSSASN